MLPDPSAGDTLYGRILARYAFRLADDGGSVWLHDREDPEARDIEVVADPDRPGETLWVHSYPGAPFSWCVYGAAVQLWRSTSVPLDRDVSSSIAQHLAPRHTQSEVSGGSNGTPDLRQALRAYRDMRAMEDTAHLRAAMRAEERAQKAASRRKWGCKRPAWLSGRKAAGKPSFSLPFSRDRPEGSS